MRIRVVSALTWLSLSILVLPACGGGMTEPAAVPKQAVGVPPTVPEGTTPTPTPTPAPAPGPSVPTPPPASSVTYYDADVATVFWQGNPLFGNRFSIEVWPERGEMWLNSTRLWIVQRDAESVIANDKNPNSSGGSYTLMATLNLKTRQWSFNGLAGSGGGTFTPRTPNSE